MSYQYILFRESGRIINQKNACFRFQTVSLRLVFKPCISRFSLLISLRNLTRVRFYKRGKFTDFVAVVALNLYMCWLTNIMKPKNSELKNNRADHDKVKKKLISKYWFRVPILQVRFISAVFEAYHKIPAQTDIKYYLFSS